MGEGVHIFCRSCGYTKDVSYGMGFNSRPNDPMVREDIMNGKYGYKPKKVLDENPDALFHWYMPLFHCKCGNISSKDSVVIRDREDGRLLYKPSLRCSLCHKKMWEIRDLPYYSPCPKCGHMMEFDYTILWD